MNQASEPLTKSTPTTSTSAAVSERVDLVADPKAGFWYLQLLWRPQSFFERYIKEPPFAAVALAAWVIGIAHAMERVDKMVLKSSLRGVDLTPSSLSFLTEGWSAYWMWVLVIGAFGGFLRYHFGGWWYRVRLGWSGVSDADGPLSRRVYVFTCLVDSIPAILYSVWQSLAYASPNEAYQGHDRGALLLLVFPFWASFVGYIGARTVFAARGTSAVMWFLALPWAIYGLGLIAIFGVLALVGL